MFFLLSKDKNPQFPNHYQFGDLILNIDNGWTIDEDSTQIQIYKGYAEGNILSQPEYGNYCIWKFDKLTKQATMATNRYRSFSTFYSPGVAVTNLIKYDNNIWADSNIIVDQNIAITEEKYDVIGEIDTSELSLADALDAVHKRIDSHVKIFLSGGMDSMLVFSYIKQHTDQYEHIFENRMQWDYFWCQNRHIISNQFWGYTQIHHWLEPCALSSGAPGDEYMLRNPDMVRTWAAYHGIDMNECFEMSNYRYSQEPYFEKSKDFVPDSNQLEMSNKDFVWSQCNQLVNDSQHWHLGNTLTFTPLLDLEIFKTIVRVNPKQLMTHVGGAEFSMELLKRNDPNLVDYLSDVKNIGTSFHNLTKLMEKL
jgi:hypothetical protein